MAVWVDKIARELIDCLVRTNAEAPCIAVERVEKLRDAYNNLAIKYEQTEAYLLRVNRRLQEQLLDLQKSLIKNGNELSYYENQRQEFEKAGGRILY